MGEGEEERMKVERRSREEEEGAGVPSGPGPLQFDTNINYATAVESGSNCYLLIITDASWMCKRNWRS